MVNKTDFSAPMQAPGADPLLQELLSKYPTMQLFAALAKIGAADFLLPSKIASQLLSQKTFEGSSKLNHLVTLLPSLKHLPPEAIKMLEAGGKSERSQHSFKKHSEEPSKESFKGHPPERFKELSKESSPELFNDSSKRRGPESFKEFSKQQARELSPELSKTSSRGGDNLGGPDKPGSGKQALEKAELAPLAKGENPQRGNEAPAKPLLQGLRLGENPTIALGLPAMLTTIKEVLAILSYFTNHANTLKLESLDAIQKAMGPVIDQLVQPVHTSARGEFGSQNREIKEQAGLEKLLLKEKNLPLPSDLRQKPEKALNEHKIERTPNNADSLDRTDYRASSPSVSRSQESSITKSNPLQPPMINPKISETEAKPASIPVPGERIAIPAAPFSFQHPISTAPRKAKKKPKDPWEEEEERFKDEEDPFSHNS